MVVRIITILNIPLIAACMMICTRTYGQTANSVTISRAQVHSVPHTALIPIPIDGTTITRDTTKSNMSASKYEGRIISDTQPMGDPHTNIPAENKTGININNSSQPR